MKGRRVVIGCAVAAAIAIVITVVAVILIFRGLTSPVPLRGAAASVDSDALGFAVLRLEPDDPWVQEMTADPEGGRRGENDARRLLPAQIVWVQRPGADGREESVLALSVSPGGRLMGLILDLALWKMGRSGDPGISRTVHGGEGITSIQLKKVRGHLFVRGNEVVWASGLDAARRMIDLAGGAGDGGGAPPFPGGIPDAGSPHTLIGALRDVDGSLSRALALLPEAAGDPPTELAALSGFSFTLDTLSGEEAAGDVRLDFAEGTSPEVAAVIASAFAGHLSGVSVLGIRLSAAPHPTDTARVTVTATGLKEAARRAALRMVEFARMLEDLNR